MKLVEFTKEGLIMHALMGSTLRYGDLKRVTGLSDAWLSKKLQELLRVGMVVLRDGHYSLNVKRFQEALRGEKTFIARLVAQELVRRMDSDVLAVVLFGSLVENSRGEGDIDLLIVTPHEDFDPLMVSVEMLRKFGVAVDIVHVTLREFLAWLYDKPPILFSVLSGFELLFDRGYIRDFLELLEREVVKEWVYVKEDKLWVRIELLPLMLKHA